MKSFTFMIFCGCLAQLSGRSAAVAAGVEIPLFQLLAEAESHRAAGHFSELAGILERVLAREGEPLKEGVTWDQVRWWAATAHLQSGNAARAEALASVLGQAGREGLKGAEVRWLIGLARAAQGKFAAAVPEFAAVAEAGFQRERAWYYQALAAREAGQPDVAIQAYSKLLASAVRDADWAEGAQALVALNIEQGHLTEARRGFDLLRTEAALVENVAGQALLALQLGEAALAAGETELALAAFQSVGSQEEILTAQSERERRLDAWIARGQQSLRRSESDWDRLRRAETRCAQMKVARAEIEKQVGFDGAVWLRLATAFDARGHAWEAALVFHRLLERCPHAPERERAYAGLVRAYLETGRGSKARAVAEQMRTAVPESSLLAATLYLVAVQAEKDGAPADALRWLSLALQAKPAPELAEPLALMQANALFAAGRQAEARAASDAYLQAFPAGRLVEEATYLRAMADLVLGHPEAALREMDAYLEHFADGRLVADARYRRATALYTLERYDEALWAAAEWLDAYPVEHAQRGEVWSLMGDLAAALEDPEAAIANYRAALDHPLADEGLGYVLDELTSLLSARREFGEAAQVWEALVARSPEHPLVVNAAYWIGRLRAREGNRAASMATLSTMALRHWGDVGNEGVERLLAELARVSAGREKRGRRAAKSEEADSTAAETDLLGALEARLAGADQKDSPTVRARFCFLEAEIASLRGDVARRDLALTRLATTFAPADLPVGILARVGDHCRDAGPAEAARTFFAALIERAPRSPWADFGYVGLGECALERGDPVEALARFDAAIDLVGARHKLKEATLGRAKCLSALGRYDEARETFERIAANRAWRGEATVQSVMGLGEILAKRGDAESLAQAQAHFQRVYVSYRRYSAWVCRAYVRSAQVLEKLGQTEAAIATYRELLNDPRLGERPEARVAREQVARWEGARG